MRYRFIIIAISVLLVFITFVSFISAIKRNEVSFSTDEIYWIQTGRILPYILEKKFSDPFWKEHVGFTNFYGAKWVYAVGLRIFGHNDFSGIRYPLGHIDQFQEFDGKAFPQTNRFFSIIMHGRYISAFTISLAIGLMFIFTMTIFPHRYVVGIISALLLVNHPTIQYIGNHVLADGMLLVAEIASLVFIARLWRARSGFTIYEHIGLGMSLGYAASVKINGSMFFVLFLVCISLKSLSGLTQRTIVNSIYLVTLSAGITFFVIHPNFYFYPSYTFLHMIQERIFITQHQKSYFALNDPDHVLFTIPQRLRSMSRHIFTLPHIILFGIGSISTLFQLLKKNNRLVNSNFLLQWIYFFIIIGYLMGYVVFDDERYFMPLLPFICLIASSWISNTLDQLLSFGRYWRASAR